MRLTMATTTKPATRRRGPNTRIASMLSAATKRAIAYAAGQTDERELARAEMSLGYVYGIGGYVGRRWIPGGMLCGAKIAAGDLIWKRGRECDELHLIVAAGGEIDPIACRVDREPRRWRVTLPDGSEIMIPAPGH